MTKKYMLKGYMVLNLGIWVVDIVKETPYTLTFIQLTPAPCNGSPQKVHKTTYQVFDTFEEAKAGLLRRLRNAAEGHLEKARLIEARIGEALLLEEPS